jgi:tetratricopeptide (TPR) repeat protein
VQALAKEPSRRYQQASALAADLVAFLELRPVSVRAATTWQRAARACRREPGKAALVGAVAVAIPVVAGLLGYLWARRGVLDAGEVALRDAAVDDLLARGFAKLYAPKRDPSCRADFAAAAKLDALRPEVALGHALVAYNFETMADAVAVLDAQPPALQAVKGVQRLRAYFAHAEAGGEPTAAAAEASAPPTDAFDHLVAGFVAYELARARGDRAGFTAAATTLARGERLWPRPSVVHLMQWVVTAIRVGEPEGIRDALDAIDTLFPHIAASSASVINHPDPARALAAAKRCVALEPRDPLWRYNLASRLHKTGDAQAALLEIEAALALDPDHLLASIQRTTILAALGRDGEALAAIEGVVRRHPDSGEAWNNLGTLRARAQQYEPALTAMREAVRLLPDSATASAKLAKLLRLTGRDQEAVAEEARFPKQ